MYQKLHSGGMRSEVADLYGEGSCFLFVMYLPLWGEFAKFFLFRTILLICSIGNTLLAMMQCERWDFFSCELQLFCPKVAESGEKFL